MAPIREPAKDDLDPDAATIPSLVVSDSLAAAFHEPLLTGERQRAALRDAFLRRFWTNDEGGHLGDVWRDGQLDRSVRPNQIFAVSLPHAVLIDDCHAQVVECVRNRLLTPYGLRTLAPDDPASPLGAARVERLSVLGDLLSSDRVDAVTH